MVNHTLPKIVHKWQKQKNYPQSSFFIKIIIKFLFGVLFFVESITGNYI